MYDMSKNSSIKARVFEVTEFKIAPQYNSTIVYETE